MKIFVLTVSQTFPKTHPKAGVDTGFVGNVSKLFTPENSKIHTIRGDTELWSKRANEINEGKAVLSIRYWSGKPYYSKQIEICRLEKIGVQKLDHSNFIHAPIEGKTINWGEIAKNDGLSFEDFVNWFNGSDKSKPMVIIHFTAFRY